ncbi:DUF2849 domain-containing protein [Asticcacaulis sp. ZE23SCel15]|uniref:DUF2849 domain-containing protein n=1 Tax=Asticcacaulis sp. ZE23SCel15 TaxID=3059027 RepID=UPI00265D96F3|nr:DUF2849 domain-containing protein [Asticcacaulis sp. ZE23SCel15]WKL58111.1 DUF2849 domain-containing protein [Asticcacaulis sp. ZE23SCel15]
MKLLTANRLTDGLVLWYADGQWVEDAALATHLEDAAGEALKAEWVARETEVVAPYLIPVTDDGTPVQRELVREFVRANGPTIGQTTFDTAKQFNRDEVFQ